MLILCPSCASEYMIDPERLGAEGRTVRCATCKGTWFVAPEPDLPDKDLDLSDEDLAGRDSSDGTDEPDTIGEPDTTDGLSATGEPEDAFFSDPVDQARGNASEAQAGLRAAAQAALRSEVEPSLGLVGRIRQFAAAPLLVLAGVIIVGAAWWGRAPIVRTFPATATLYAGIGIPVNLRGLEFRAVRSELVAAGSDTFLVVEGEIANISGRDAPVPPIEIGLRGAEGQMLYTWTNDPPRQTLAMSDMAHFRARLAAPPAEARQVLVRFAAGRDGAAVASQMR